MSEDNAVYLNLGPEHAISALASTGRRLLGRFSPISDDVIVCSIGTEIYHSNSTKKIQSFEQDQRIQIVHWMKKDSKALSFFKETSFLSDTLSIFLDFQQQRKGQGLIDVPEHAVQRTSSEYLAFLVKQKEKMGGGGRSMMWKAMYTIWSLMDILWIKPSTRVLNVGSSDPMVARLLEWVQHVLVDMTMLERLVQDIVSYPDPLRHSQYWSTVFYCLLHGLTMNAVELLQSASSANNNKMKVIFHPLIDLLQQMPAIKYASASSAVTQQQNIYKMKWLEWKQLLSDTTEQYMSIMDSSNLATSTTGGPYVITAIKKIIGLLNGNVVTIQELSSGILTIESNIETSGSPRTEEIVKVLALAMYSRPTATLNEISAMFDDFSSVQESNHVVHVDKIASSLRNNIMDQMNACIRALLSMDVLKVLRHASALDVWLVAHMSDIVSQIPDLIPEKEAIMKETENLGLIKHKTYLTLNNIRDYFVTNFAEWLYGVVGDWYLAVHYFHYTGVQGEASASSILTHLSTSITFTESDSNLVSKAEQFMLQYGYVPEWQAHHRIIGKQYLNFKNGRRLGDALLHYCLACDEVQVATIIDRLLKIHFRYIEQQQNTESMSLKELQSIASQVKLEKLDLIFQKMSFDMNQSNENHLFLNMTFGMKNNGYLRFFIRFVDCLVWIGQDDGEMMDQKAIEVLILLLTSHTVPNVWVFETMRKCFEIIEKKRIVLSSQDCFELLRILEMIRIHESNDFSLERNRFMQKWTILLTDPILFSLSL